MSGWLGLGIVLVLFGTNLQLYALMEVNKAIAKALTDIRDEISALYENNKYEKWLKEGGDGSQ